MIFFGIDKIVAFIRQALIARQFGFSPEIDAFNVANNLPDLLFSVFSGGALALVIIPVFTEHIGKHGRDLSWKLFSKIANIVFLFTLILAIIFWFGAKFIVSSKFGISPGFSVSQQGLVVELMRINLISLIIFSLSGIVMASLQANKHFFLTALAPIIYNVGLIFGVVIFSPQTGITIGGLTLPSFGFGIYGLVYGTVLGALLHLAIQIPGLVIYKFRWTFSFDFRSPDVQKIMRLMGPRILTVFLIQIIFLARDNLASHMAQGSVTALTYGYFIMQVPETLIGTAIATALLPTLSELISVKKRQVFMASVQKSLQVIIVSTLIITFLLSITLPQFLYVLFDFKTSEVALLTWTTRAFLVGLIGHSLLEVVARAYYAQQNAILPLIATALRTTVFLTISILSFKITGAVGLAAADSIAVSVEVVFLLVFFNRMFPILSALKSTFARSLFGSIVSACIVFLIISLFSHLPIFPTSLIAILAGVIIYSFFVRQEMALA